MGSIEDAYFDDAEWALRYLVVTTGSWLSGRSVLITPDAIRGVEWDGGRVDLNLTREQVRNAPDVETDRPISRQYEIAYYDHYGYPYYWTNQSAWDPAGFSGVASAPAGVTASQRRAATQERDVSLSRGDPHLRSAKEVVGYDIQAADGSIGHVKDLLFDDESWMLRFFIVDTKNWLPGRKVLISTDWIERVDWVNRSVEVTMTRDEVRNSPEYDPPHLSERDEEMLYEHYGRTRPHRFTRVQIR
jgi:hypothetical protein